jgi:dipeptidase E
VDDACRDDLSSRGNKVLYIPIALKRSDKYETCEDWFTQIYPDDRFDIDTLRDPSKNISFKNYDLIYIGGGNTYSLLDDLRKNDLVQPLKDYVDAEGMVYGGSAGAIILGEHIGTAVGDENYVGLNDFDGLGLARGYDFRPHYTERHRQAVTDHIERTGNPVMCCPEESGVRLQGDEARVLGKKPVILRLGNQEIRVKPGSTVGLERYTI